MSYVRFEVDERPGQVLEAKVLNSWAQRLKGLLGTGPDAGAVVLTRCFSVHSVGMRYALDLAFIGEKGEVLKVYRGFPPGEMAACEHAMCVLERPADAEAPWPKAGEHLWIAAISAEAA